MLFISSPRFQDSSWWWRCPAWEIFCLGKAHGAFAHFPGPSRLSYITTGVWKLQVVFSPPGVISSTLRFSHFISPSSWFGQHWYIRHTLYRPLLFSTVYLKKQKLLRLVFNMHFVFCRWLVWCPHWLETLEDLGAEATFSPWHKYLSAWDNLCLTLLGNTEKRKLKVPSKKK